MLLLNIAVFVLAQLGHIAWLRRRTGLDVAFVPALAFTAQGLAVFMGGLLGILPQTAWGMLVLGVALLAFEAWRAPDRLRQLLLEPAMLLLAVAALALGWFLRDQLFVNYDNFSHWAVVVKVMLAEGHLPTAEDTIVMFQSYPLGSASFVYLLNRTVSASEPAAMLAQQLLTFSYVLALLAATPRHKAVGVIATIGAYVAITNNGIFVNSLLVDTLLGVMSGYLMLLVWAHRDRLWILPVPIAIITMFLAMTKNSGLFTVIIATGAVLVLHRLDRTGHRAEATLPAGHRTGRSRTIWWLVSALLAPWAILVWWNVHVAATFPAGLASKHSLSAGRFGDILGEKSLEDVRTIIGSFAGEVLWHPPTLVLTLALLAAVLLLQHSRLVSRPVARWLFGGGVLIYVLYVLGILAMFLVSMPLGEALHLRGLHRYLGTAHVAWLMVILWLLLVVVERARRVGHRQISAATAVATVVIFGALGSQNPLTPPDLSESPRARVDAAVAASGPLPDGDTVCVILDRPDAGLRRFIVRYVLTTDQVGEVTINSDTKPYKPERCDNFMLLIDNPAAEAWLATQGITPPGPAPYLVRRPQ